jgi:hypothetical protein
MYDVIIKEFMILVQLYMIVYVNIYLNDVKLRI